ncbi:MAG: DUF4382 domain-containing protein [Planctomycetes bacterium]|nr:DUF4382 domain-containing protein [Planctomycetota bacterium]
MTRTMTRTTRTLTRETRTTITLAAAVAIGLLGGLTVGCGGSSGGGGGAATAAAGATGDGQLEVQLTDAPLKDLTLVTKAEVTVERVEVHVAPAGGAASSSGAGTGPAALPANAMGGNANANAGNANAGNANAGNANAGNASTGAGNANAGNANAGNASTGAGNANPSSNAAANAMGANPNAAAAGAAGGPPSGGTWLTIFDAAQAGATKSYDLLDLRGGITAELARATLPAGHYTHMRLVLSGAELVHDQTSYSTANGGLTIVNGAILITFSGPNAIVVQPGQTTQVLLDFDIGRSFNSVGPPAAPTGFMLMPTVRGANLATTGAVAGVVLSDGRTPGDASDDAPLASVTVTATRPGTVVTTYTDAQGAYYLAGLDDGSWDVTFQAPNHDDQTVTVTVVAQQQTTQDVLLAGN